MSFGGSREIFQNVSATRALWTKSFEEHRIDDYIKAYSTTSKPPIPCPPTPLDAHQRNLHGLPPLFQPHVEMAFSASQYANNADMQDANTTTNSEVIADPTLLPATQVFRVTREGADKFQSIVLQTEFTNFCPEELRYHAYARGNKLPPTPIPSTSAAGSTLGIAPSSFSGTSLSLFTPVKSPLAAADPRNAESSDQYQSISTQPGFILHSVEELRVAFLRHGRELTSAEIYHSQGQVPPAASGSPVAPTTTSSLFSPSSTSTPASTNSLFSPVPPSQPQSSLLFAPGAASTPARTSLFSGSVSTPSLFTTTPAQPPPISTTFSFGGTPAPAIASSSSSSGFSFGLGGNSNAAAAPASGVFGAAPVSVPAPTTSLFGAPLQTPAANNTGTGSLFGGPSNAFRRF